MRRRKSSSIGAVVAMLAASVIVHLVMWPVGNKVMSYGWGGPPIPISGGVFEVSLMPAEDSEDERQPKDEEPVEREDDRVEFPGELVQLDELTDERPPDDAKFVSEFDNRTDQQTKAPNVRRPKDGSDGQPGQPSDGRDQSPRSSPDPSKQLPLGRVPNDMEGGQPIDASDSGNVKSGAEARPPAASLSPRIGTGQNASAMLKTFGGPSSIDHADDVEEGDATILNSKRWKYASFFNRVRNAIDQEWEPAEVHKAHDPEGRLFGTRTRRTQLVIRLHPDGSVAKIRLDRSSGAPHLDEEAIRAVRAAQPFANPPEGLVDPQTGFIEFGFGFIFEFEGKSRIFRYRG